MSKKTKDGDYKRLTITLPVDTIELLKELSDIEHRSMSNMVDFSIHSFAKYYNTMDRDFDFQKITKKKK